MCPIPQYTDLTYIGGTGTSETIKIIFKRQYTDPSDDTAKDSFYCQYEGDLSNTPQGDIVIILGEFNAKIGNNKCKP